MIKNVSGRRIVFGRFSVNAGDKVPNVPYTKEERIIIKNYLASGKFIDTEAKVVAVAKTVEAAVEEKPAERETVCITPKRSRRRRKKAEAAAVAEQPVASEPDAFENSVMEDMFNVG